VEQLQAKHHAGKKADQHDDRGGSGADIVDMLGDALQLFFGKNLYQGPGKKEGDPAEAANQMQEEGACLFDEVEGRC